jgi:hypothetical protein
MRACSTILLLLCMLSGYSQSVNINLSARHQKKLSEVESGHKRMKKFYKYFKKDSAQHFKQINKKEKKSWDSTMRATRKQEKLKKKVADRNPALHHSNQLDSIDGQIKTWIAILNDTTQNDSLRAVARENVKDLMLTKLKLDPNFNLIETKYSSLPDSLTWEDFATQIPGIDSVQGIFANPKDLLDHSASFTEKQLGGITEVQPIITANHQLSEFKGMSEMYRDKNGSYLNRDSLTEAGKDKAAEKALDYFAENPEKLEAAIQKASKLFSKYRVFSNSNDLSDARKNTSMEGKTLLERLVIGGTFNVISTKPLSLDLSPQLGYKFNARFFVGAGMNYRMTFSDSIKHNWYVSPRNTAFKTFMNYDVVKSWYAYLEGEISGAAGHSIEQKEKGDWNVNYFVGAGRRFLVHPKLFMTITALYNLNNQAQNHIYPQRFQVRVGFQTSDLAFRNKKVTYDPNR